MLWSLEDDRVGGGEVSVNPHDGIVDVNTSTDCYVEEDNVPMEHGASVLLFHGLKGWACWH
jgi:hypothetical protein